MAISRLHKKQLLDSLTVGEVVSISQAHLWDKNYGYSKYSKGEYVIEKLNKKEITVRSKKYYMEKMGISRADLDDGRFIFDLK